MIVAGITIRKLWPRFGPELVPGIREPAPGERVGRRHISSMLTSVASFRPETTITYIGIR